MLPPNTLSSLASQQPAAKWRWAVYGECLRRQCTAAVYGGYARRLSIQDIGVTGQAFQYDPKARLAPASQPAAAVTRPLHSINL
jgi:hypothetical protein